MTTEPEPPSGRTLQRDVPELIPYLRSGMDVLDVGCGRGTITVGVAQVVAPGSVVGLDPAEQELSKAREWTSSILSDGTVRYCLGDAHRLEFDDNRFDLVYSYTAAHFYLDPVRALREQMRVTRSGGWVICAGVRDIADRYPECPNWARVWDAWSAYCDAIREECVSGARDPVEALRTFVSEYEGDYYHSVLHYDLRAGRKFPRWYYEAGFAEIRVTARIIDNLATGWDMLAEPRQPGILDLVDFEGMPAGMRRLFDGMHARLVAAGYLERETILKAEQEAREFYRLPYAQEHFLHYFIAGRVP